MACSLLSHLLTPHPRSSFFLLFGLLPHLILSSGCKEWDLLWFLGSRRENRGRKQGEEEKNKANYEILMGNMDNLIITILFLPQFSHLLSLSSSISYRNFFF